MMKSWKMKTPMMNKKMSNPIRMQPSGLVVPPHPTIPFIIGDGSGPDIWRASQPVIDAAVRSAYSDTRSIDWMEVLAGQ